MHLATNGCSVHSNHLTRILWRRCIWPMDDDHAPRVHALRRIWLDQYLRYSHLCDLIEGSVNVEQSLHELSEQWKLSLLSGHFLKINDAGSEPLFASYSQTTSCREQWNTQILRGFHCDTRYVQRKRGKSSSEKLWEKSNTSFSYFVYITNFIVSSDR